MNRKITLALCAMVVGYIGIDQSRAEVSRYACHPFAEYTMYCIGQATSLTVERLPAEHRCRIKLNMQPKSGMTQARINELMDQGRISVRSYFWNWTYFQDLDLIDVRPDVIELSLDDRYLGSGGVITNLRAALIDGRNGQSLVEFTDHAIAEDVVCK